MNNKIFKMIAVLAIVILSNGSVYAQSNISKNEDLKRRAAECVAQMNDYIQFMSDKDKALKTRGVYRSEALNLFIAQGEAYEEETTDEFGRTQKIHKDGAMMEITSKFRRKPTHRLIKDYFTALMNLRYTKVDIQSTDVADIEVSNLKKVGDGHYTCTCYFEQAFCGYRDGKPVYKDITRKKVECHIFVLDTEEGELYIVRLGDVTALETI
jgi:hypothetical protein